jgi:SET domain-containing protein
MTHSSFIEVRQVPGGEQGVFALRDIPAGTFIGAFTGRETGTPTRHSLQIGPDRHIDPAPDCALAFLNHACNPVSAFRGTDLYAVCPIAAGAEVTIDYNCHEADMTAPFPCSCGGSACVGHVAGWLYLDARQRVERAGRAALWLTAKG